MEIDLEQARRRAKELLRAARAEMLMLWHGCAMTAARGWRMRSERWRPSLGSIRGRRWLHGWRRGREIAAIAARGW